MKKFIYFSLLTLFILSACTPKVGEQAAETSEPPETIESSAGNMVESVINTYIEAVGGKEAIMAITDLEKSMEANTGMGAIKMNQFIKDGKFAMKIMAQGMTVQEIKYDGESAKMSGMQGDQEITDPTQIEGFAQQAKIYPELDYLSNNYTITYEGEDKHKGEEAHVLKVVTGSGSIMKEFYSKESGLKIFVEGETEMNGQTQNTKTTFDDYRSVGGVKFPYSISLSGAMPFELNMEVTEIKVNEGISDTVFLIN